MKTLKIILNVVLALIIALSLTAVAFADSEPAAVETADESELETASENSVRSTKAIAAAIIIGVVSAVGAIGMAMTIVRSTDGIARQPEASSDIRGSMMLGLVFIETAIIYALIVAILVIFVL